MKPTNVRASAEILQAIARKRAELKELEDMHRPLVEEAMGEDEIGEMDGKVAITWRHQKQRRLDQRRLRDKSPAKPRSAPT